MSLARKPQIAERNRRARLELVTAAEQSDNRAHGKKYANAVLPPHAGYL